MAHSKAVPLCIRNEAEWRRALFLPFLLNFKSGVTRIKNEAEGHRALVKHRDARAGEEVEVLRGSLRGVVWVLQAAQLHLRLQEAVLLPGRADWGHVLPRVGQQVDLGARVAPMSFVKPPW